MIDRRWTSREVLLNNTNVSVGASETNTVVSDNFRVGNTNYLIVDVNCSGISETTGLTIKLQDSSGAVGGSDVWNTKGSEANVAITGTAAVDTLTCDTKANTVDGDYIVYTDQAGNSWAIAFDTTGGGANTPTGAVWTAIPAGRKGEADISGSTTAADVAAVVESTIDALSGFTSVCTTDDTAADGTMTFTAVAAGPTTSVAVYAKDDTAATTPALAFASTTAGVATGTFSFVLMVENSNDQAELPLRPKCRVVVTTGSGDAVTVASVRASYFE